MFEKLIIRIAATLNKYDMPYMIIGGQAVLLYGSPRLTMDIDITLGLGSGKLPLVVDALREIGLKIIPEHYEEFVRETSVLPAKDETTGIRVDFIFSFTPYEQKAISRARNVAIDDGTARFASVEDVIIHKIFAGRPRDLEDVLGILHKNAAIDVEYIGLWLKEFESSTERQGTFMDVFETLLEETKK
jgi:hypothetical protein